MGASKWWLRTSCCRIDERGGGGVGVGEVGARVADLNENGDNPFEQGDRRQGCHVATSGTLVDLPLPSRAEGEVSKTPDSGPALLDT